MDEAPSCRFCYESETTETNPFLMPCECRGSLTYIHVQCLLKWRATTQNPEFVSKCCICKSAFVFPVRWPRNIVCIPNRYVWRILSNSSVMIAIAYYAHFCMMLVNPIGSLNLYFSYVCCAIASLYAGVYAYVLWPVYEKRRYLTYWWRNDIICGHYSTRQMVIYTTVACVCLPWCYYPMGAFFLYMLPQFQDMHATIIQKMNADAEIILIPNENARLLQ
jgi:hypothetical protein